MTKSKFKRWHKQEKCKVGIPLTFFRSSSFNNWTFCQMQFFLSYTLGLKAPSGKKAEKGSIVHKVLELLARKKLAIQQGNVDFADDELGLTWDTKSFTLDNAIGNAWRYYTNSEKTTYEWLPEDLVDVREWSLKAMAYNDGLYNPLKRTVIWPEKYVDFTIDKPEFRYSYTLPDGQKLEGHLGMKGTLDLVCGVDGFPDTIEYIDWKTGKRLDWATGETKDYKKLRNDPQLRMYHYALSRVFPQAKQIVVTIVFINDGGPFPLPYTMDDLAETEKMLKERFDAIRNCSRPKPIAGDRSVWRSYWKCNTLCAFGGSHKWGDSDKTVCAHFRDELRQLGMDRVLKKYGDMKALSEYGSGGGRSTAPKPEHI